MIITSYDIKQLRMLRRYRKVFLKNWGKHKVLKGITYKTILPNTKKNFFPKVIVNCEYDNIFRNGRNKSGKATPKRSFKSLVNCHPLIANRINYLKSLAIKYNYKKMEDLYFGTCAEDDAANKVLIQCKNVSPKLSELKFTKAIRCRTGQNIPYCAICERTFG